ncbi:MAG: cell wall hydrolase [Hyphomicrobiales bacterium]
MSRKNLTAQLSSAAMCGAAVLALTVAFPNSIDFQDVSAFAGKKLGEDRWLASIVTSPAALGRDFVKRKGASPMIMDENGVLLKGMDIGSGKSFKGYAFAPTPAIAKIVSKEPSVQAAKGDLPVGKYGRKAGSLSAGVMFDGSSILSAPNAQLWPTVAFVSPTPAPVATPAAVTKIDQKQDRPRRKVLVAKKEAAPTAKSAPLALIPEAAIAAIQNDAAEQANIEIDTTVTASIPQVAQVQTGYAAKTNDPRAVFEAVLARRDGKHAVLPVAPNGQVKVVEPQQQAILTPVYEGFADVPVPRLKPEVAESLEPQKRKSGKKLHFWAGFKLPGSVYRKNQQRCLAAGIYFESRGEIEKGQAAVAQVILNRVKAPAYPNTICGVVYQNKHWRNRCQFSFACDGIYDRVNDKKSWKTAVRIARDVSKGKIYLDEVADSTHYHATYVSPKWGRTMKVLTRIGVHIFYRTKNGGWS